MKAATPPAPAGLRTAAALIAWNLAALLLAIRWRLAPAEWPFAWPAPGAGLLAGPWPVVLAGVAAALVLLALCRRPAPARRALAVLLLWPAAPLAATWALLPLDGATAGRILPWAVPLLLAGGVLWWTGRQGPPARAAAPAHRLRWWAWHGPPLAAAVGVGLWQGGFTDPGAVALSLATYPLYALAQLALILAAPWPWLWRATGGRPAPAVAVVATWFALVHWPNPVLVAGTGVGMLVWARAYAAGRSLGPLALSMGLWATVLAQGLPATVTGGMRVGPEATRARAVAALTARGLAAAPTDAGALGQARALLADLYPAVTGRAASPAELDRWLGTVRHEQRCLLAWEFLASAEARRRQLAAAVPPADGAYYWTELPAAARRRIREHAASLPADAPWRTVVARCYRDLLGREPGPGELAAWDRPLTRRQHATLVRELLRRHRSLAVAPFDTLASDAWRFWR